MGFKDADRVLWLNREHQAGFSLAESAVLTVIAHHTNDKTHKTIVGQQRIAAELGCEVKTVQRAVGVLTTSGVISRQPRVNNGYKTTDEITFHHEWEGTKSHPTKSRPTQSRKTLSPTSPDSKSPKQGLKVRAEEITQEITQIDHSVDTPTDLETDDRAYWEGRTFDEFWVHWPRSEGKAAASKSWIKAIKKVDAKVLVDWAKAFHASPYRPPKQFIPHASTWLNGERWTDPLPEAPESDSRNSPKPTKVDQGRAAHEELLRRAAASKTPALENAS